jgi:hypothetical protein
MKKLYDELMLGGRERPPGQERAMRKPKKMSVSEKEEAQLRSLSDMMTSGGPPEVTYVPNDVYEALRATSPKWPGDKYSVTPVEGADMVRIERKRMANGLLA